MTINNTKHFVRSAENYDASRGIEGSFLLIDEAAYVSEEATDMFIGRIRVGQELKKRYVSSPNGFNHFYHRHHPQGDMFDKSRKMIQAKTSDNIFLPKNYEISLRRAYSSKMALQELDAEFISLAGLGCYSDFNRKIHVANCKSKFTGSQAQQLFVVVDYNVSPFAGVVGFMEEDRLYIIGEIYLEGGADTRMMAKEIKRKWGQYDPIVIGDGTGNNKRSIINIKQTSYSIFNEEGLRTVPFHNPHVVKRLANVNRLFFHNLLVVDPSCKHLIKDFEMVIYSKSSNDIDKTSNRELTHISDAAGYFCWHLSRLPNLRKKTKAYTL